MKYQCQAQIQKTIDEIAPVPAQFDVSEQYLNGLDNVTFVRCFHEFRGILANVYQDMFKFPEEYGLILVGMDVSEYKNSRPRDSRASAKRLIALIHLLGRAGELAGNELHITPESFSEISKVKYVGFSWTQNAAMILKKLAEFGFNFVRLKGNSIDKDAGMYILSYPNNPAMMRMLKGYAMSVPVIPHFPKELTSLAHYTLLNAKEDAPISVEFAVPLKTKERDLLDQLMNTVQTDYIDECKALIEYAVSLGYLPHKTAVSGFAVSFTSKKTGRTIMKLTPNTGLNHRKFIPKLSMKFPATKVHSAVFTEAVKREMESNGGLYTGCFGCGKCAGEADSYVYEYPNGKHDFVCSNALMNPDWHREDVEEIKEMMKTQDDFWLAQN